MQADKKKQAQGERKQKTISPYFSITEHFILHFGMYIKYFIIY